MAGGVEVRFDVNLSWIQMIREVKLMAEEKILVVDDDRAVRTMMERALVKLGYNVVIAADAGEAIEILDEEFFPLIITDLIMPGGDGAELCGRIRETNQKSVIYALSGHLGEYEVDNLEALGFDGYLIKPAKLEVLEKAIRGALGKAAAGR